MINAQNGFFLTLYTARIGSGAFKLKNYACRIFLALTQGRSFFLHLQPPTIYDDLNEVSRSASVICYIRREYISGSEIHREAVARRKLTDDVNISFDVLVAPFGRCTRLAQEWR